MEGWTSEPFTADVINDGDVITYKSIPGVLASGHPLRRRNCQICGVCIGSQMMRIVVIVPMTECTCPYQELHSIAYLVCAKHAEPDDLAIAAAAIEEQVFDPGRLS